MPGKVLIPACLIAGDSISKRLDSEKLGKGRMKVLNISEGGNRIRDIQKSIETFVIEYGSMYCIQKILISMGSNDIRYCKNGVGHLQPIIKGLFTYIKLIFPHAKVYIQSLLPQPITNEFVVKNILSFNRMLFDACVEKEIYYMDVLKDFLNFRNLRINKLFLDAVHPNAQGMGRLARSYIRLIHREKFNPLIRL